MTKSAGFIDFSDQGGDQGRWHGPAQRTYCHESHPDLHIGGGILVGGNCRNHARHKDVDLYVALDGSMEHPLYEVGKAPPHCVYYPIKNMKVPTRPDKFEALVDMIVGVLGKGGKVHVGCIGGHGRTGLVIGAVVARLEIAPENDAINWVRKHYCKRAIETAGQEGFLITYFGSKPIPPRKDKSVDKSLPGF